MSVTFETEKERAAREAYLQIAEATDRFERYAKPHAVRIAALAEAIAIQFHLAEHDRRALRTAAHMHDLGEVAMEREYIQRAGSLTVEERLDLARHPVIGEQEAARASADRAVQLLVRWHHEWWNGSGYPDALRQHEIPLGARILRLADSYAALTDGRPYRRAFNEEEARRTIIESAGIEFDPAVVHAFVSLDESEAMKSFAVSEQTETGTTEPATEEPALFSTFK